jgi:predicted MPP superfamily phosphohydrolase
MHNSEKILALVFVGSIASVYVLEICLIAAFVCRRLKRTKDSPTRLSKAAPLIHALAVIGIICFAYGYFIEPYWIEVTTVEIQTKKLKDTSLRLLHISDMHCERPRNEKKLVKLINGLEPDIIVFTGDSLNTSKALPTFKETLNNVNAKLGKFAVRGNFDIWFWHDLDLFTGTGFKALDAETVTLQKDGEKFRITGLNCKPPSRFSEVLAKIPDDSFSIFLYHFSDLVEDLEYFNVDLYLCGHTHGGQIAMPLYGALITLSKFGKKYEAGMYNVGDTIMYVNRGIGMEAGIAPRVRFLARPEITVFEITPARNKPG